MLKKTGIVALFVLGLWASAPGTASADDVLLTQVAGDVRVSGKGGARSAVPLMKVSEGDTLTLAGGARVQMVYLGGGRQEIWQGAGQVDVGGQQGRSAALKPEASQLSALILKQLARTPAVGEQQRRTGMVMVRGVDDLEAQDRLEKDYEEFRASAAAGDTTPEVFLLSGMLEFQDYDGMRKVLADLKAKHPGQPAYAALVEHFTRLVDAASAASPNR
jgi:hypothetical protein